jgi:selenocysteine-specific translation elongation factor
MVFMNMVISVPVDENLASFIGKKGSENSITFYNRKLENDVIVALYPNQEEEKVYALAQSLLLSTQVVLSTSVIDRKFGEALIAASLLGRPLLLTDDNDAEGILHGSGLSGYKIVSKAELFDALHKNVQQPDESKPVRVDIDKGFPVKGVGTVALGIVSRGVIKQHDKMYHTSGKLVTVRGLQSQDVDITSAGVGTRVGVSLKDITHEDIGKGDLLTPTLVGRAAKITVEFKTSKMAAEKVAEGAQYRLVMGFAFSDCEVIKVNGSDMELELKAKLPAEIGTEVLLIRKAVPRIFAAGKVKAVLG